MLTYIQAKRIYKDYVLWYEVEKSYNLETAYTSFNRRTHILFKNLDNTTLKKLVKYIQKGGFNKYYKF